MRLPVFKIVPQGDAHGDDQSFAGAAAHVEAVVTAVELLQAGARVGHADAFVVVRRQTGAVIADLEFQQAVLTLGPDVDATRRLRGDDAVANGVLGERLQEKRRHHPEFGAGRQRHFSAKAVAESHTLDVQIPAHERRFGVHRDSRL